MGRAHDAGAEALAARGRHRHGNAAGTGIAGAEPGETFEALPEPGKARLHFRIVLYTAYQDANAARAVRLLRARRERPCGSSATDKGDEFPALHSITSSAMASSPGANVRPSASSRLSSSPAA